MKETIWLATNIWRLPLVIFIRAPLVVTGYALEWLGLQIAAIGGAVPGLKKGARP